ELDFRILSHYHGDYMYPGQIIEYKVRPLLGVPVYWMTEITQVAEGKFFIDEQRFGPYALWHHQHHFSEIAGGVEMTDIVHYRLPLGWLGNMAHDWFVKAKVRQIFAYRFQAVSRLFGEWQGQTTVLEMH
ncbi:MAG TPA: SRPBCC family protein, partial [Sediminibacterium sp.]|nr:SRPBCC family protein [Sediminibacterium sp.]